MADYTTELQKAVEFSFDELARNNGDVSRLPIELQTVVRVVSARGVFGNGGLQYFIENDWEGTPSYQVFVDAFRRIGANELAVAIEGLSGLLGPTSHLDRTRRWARFEELWGMNPSPLDEFLFDPVTVYEICEQTDSRLEQYVTKHRSAFTTV
jgi:hypothetical protein